MNKLFSKIAALSVGLAMAVGVGVAVGHEAFREARADETYSMTPDGTTTGSSSTSYVTTLTEFTYGGISWKMNQWNPSTLQVKTNQSSAASEFRFYNTSEFSGRITGVTITFSALGVSDATKLMFLGGTSEVTATTGGTAGTWNSTSKTLSWTPGASDNFTYFAFYQNGKAASGANYLASSNAIVVTYESGVEPTGPFTVTYDGNGATSGSMTDSKEYESGETVTIMACAFMRTDYEVTGWNTKADGSGTSYVLSGQFEITKNVTLYAQWKFIGKGSENDPFTVAEALAKANEIGAVGNVGQGPWVTRGIISRVTSAPAATFWNATYYISDDGSQTNELQVYRGYYIDNVQFDETTAALLTVGKIATVYGNLTGSYGCEYTQGNYLLALEEQSTGDVDVVFEPETSIEIYDTGTFTATSETAGVVFTWAVDKPEVLSVNETTGEYEALAYGSAKVTVTATAGDKTGSTYAVIVVNGSSYSFLDVTDAIDIASKLESGKTTEYYVCFAGYVKEFGTSVKDGKPRAFDIQNEKQDASIMVYTNIDPYEEFVSGLQLGTLVRVKANIQNYDGKYELVSPVKMYTEYVAMTFAYELLEETDKVCEGYDGVTNNHDAIEAIWTAMKPKYEALNSAQQSRLVNPSLYGAGETVVNAMKRYDYLTGKYDLENFITGRTPVVFSNVNSQFDENNSSSTIIIVIASISVLSFGLALALRKKRTK